jgi:hypothetical protein
VGKTGWTVALAGVGSMSDRTGWGAALVLTALGLTMGAAHALELPQKLAYTPELYSAVNSTLYRYFGIVGGVIQVAALVSVVLLAFRLRGSLCAGGVIGAAVLLAVSLVVWAVLVQSVNSQVARAFAEAPDTLVALWARRRPQWEYGHLAAFLAWLAGFGVLLRTILQKVPETQADAAVTSETLTAPRRRASL